MKTIETKVIDLHDLTLDESLQWVNQNQDSGKFNFLVTPNIDHMSRLINQPEVYEPIYSNADLCLCDSRILRLLMKIKNYNISSVVPGSDLTAALFESGLLLDKRVLIFGGENEVFSKLKKNYPNLNLKHINPSMGFIKKSKEIPLLVNEIVDFSPDILFLAVGSPQQEQFAIELNRHLKKGVALCIGASILFITGGERRAPAVLQKLHLEWLFRMIVAPRLIKRYWSNFTSLVRLHRSI